MVKQNRASDQVSPSVNKCLQVNVGSVSWSPRVKEDMELTNQPKLIPKTASTNASKPSEKNKQSHQSSPNSSQKTNQQPTIAKKPSALPQVMPKGHKKKLYCGLSNGNQTDFMNATLQMLYNENSLRYYFVAECISGLVHGALGKLFYSMNSLAKLKYGHVANMDTFCETMLNCNFHLTNGIGNRRNSLEFLTTILSAAHQEWNPVDHANTVKAPKNAEEASTHRTEQHERSFLSDSMMIRLKTVLTCNECNKMNVMQNIDWTFNLTLPPVTLKNTSDTDLSIDLCIEDTLRQVVVESNCLHCHQRRLCSKQLSISRIPPILIIHLKRQNLSDKQQPRLVTVKDTLWLNGHWLILKSAVLCSNIYWAFVKESEHQWTSLWNEHVTLGMGRKYALEELSQHACLLLYRQTNLDAICKDDQVPESEATYKFMFKNGNDNEQKEATPHSNVNGNGVLVDDDSLRFYQNFTKNSLAEEYLYPAGLFGYCGLKNLDLSCYANSCLQTLFNTSTIRQRITDHHQSGPFHKTMSELFNQMKTESERDENPYLPFASVKPSKFMAQFRATKPDFRENTMADAQEFLTILLELIHQEANTAQKLAKSGKQPEPKTAEEAWNFHLTHVDQSYLSVLLMGQIETTLACLTCQHQSKSWSCFWQLQLQLGTGAANAATVPATKSAGQDKSDINEEKVLTLKDCIKAYCEEEILCNDSSPNCLQCQSPQPATKWTSILRVASYLVVHLKRFAPDGTKLHCKVAVDERLQVAGQSFVLCSAVLHSGTESRGHNYTLHRQADQKWVRLNDDIVDKNLTQQLADEELTVHAYLCLYQNSETDGQTSSKQQTGNNNSSGKDA